MSRTVQVAYRGPAVVLVGLSVVVPLLAPAYAASGLLLALALIVAAGASAWGVRSGDATGAAGCRAWLYFGISLAAWLCVTSAFADDPWTSFLGLAGQHNGTTLWVAALAVATASALAASKRSLRAVIVTAAGGFGILALLAVLEALGAPISAGRLWGSAAGVLENSLSAAQTFIVGGSASVAWAMFASGRSERLVAIACAALSLGGIVVTDSRAGVVGLAIGLAAGLMLAVDRGSSKTERGVAAVLTAIATGGTGLGLAVAGGALGSSAFDALNSVGTDRALIWRSAVVRLGESPFVGCGVEQFSAWIDWSLQPGGALSYYGAYDPHNVLLALLLGGGIVALALGILTAATVFRGLVTTWNASGRPMFMLVLIAGIVALAFSTLFAWVSVPAAIGAAAIVGTLLGLDRERSVSMRRASGEAHRVAVTALAVACAAFALAAAVVMPAEFRALPGADVDALLEGALTGHDPDIATRALAATLDSVGPGDEAAALVDRYAAARRWHVDLALRTLAYQQMRSAVHGDDTFAAFVQTANQGLEADPASGIWYFLTALEAERLGMVPEARRYAGLALDYPIGDAERIQLQRILGL
ncbi:MAG: O-antigen ligase family protein [Anaerosomatales bacterium]|nr:O-antigen ligase family protein [Anaerosomatales bacterium]